MAARKAKEKKAKATAKKRQAEKTQREKIAGSLSEARFIGPIVHPIIDLWSHKEFVKFFSRLLAIIFIFGFAYTALDLHFQSLVGIAQFEQTMASFRLPGLTYAVGSMFTQVFFLIILYLIAKNKLMKLKRIEVSNRWPVFAFLAIVFFLLYALIKQFIVASFDQAMAMQEAVYALKYITLFGAIACLGLTLIDYKFVRRGIKNFWKELIIAFIFLQVFNYAAHVLLYSYDLFVNEWVFFAYITTIGATFLLSFFFPGAAFSYESIYRPIIMVPGFSGIIARSCSGIIGLSLFALLFGLILVMDWHQINKLKAAIIFPIGLAGMLLVNIFRIFSLFAAGALVSPSFAIGLFHTNIGLILFLVYFLVFEFYTYNWLRR